MFADYDRPQRSKTSDILLLVPLDAPSLSLDATGKTLTIAWVDNSKVKDLAREDGPPYLAQYQLTIVHSGHQSPIQLTVDRVRSEVEIPLSDLQPDVTDAGSEQEPEEYTLSVTVRQIIDANPALAGPDSQAAKIAVEPEEQLPAANIGEDILGHWEIYSTYSNCGFFAPPGLTAEELTRWNAELGITGEPETRRFSIVFERDGTFYAETRSAEGIVDSIFSGTYSAIEQPHDPGERIYLAGIDPTSIVNRGQMPYRAAHNLKFYFVEKDGKRLLYEETGQFYLQ